jgi:hypothetical protein
MIVPLLPAPAALSPARRPKSPPLKGLHLD